MGKKSKKTAFTEFECNDYDLLRYADMQTLNQCILRSSINKFNSLTLVVNLDDVNEDLGVTLYNRLRTKESRNTLLLSYKVFKEYFQNNSPQMPLNTILYFTSHGYLNRIHTYSGQELAKEIFDIIKRTEIYKIKLSACYTGNKIDHPLDVALSSSDLIKDRLQSAAESMSGYFAQNNLKKVLVYGYLGQMKEQRKSKELHTYVEDNQGNKERASNARVCFQDGIRCESPVSCNLKNSISLIDENGSSTKVSLSF